MVEKKVTTTTIQTAPVLPATPPAPVVIEKIKYKRKKSIVTFLSGSVLLLCLFIVISAIIATAVWLHTFKVFTQEKTAGELYVSKRYIQDGKPMVKIKYTPYDDVSGWWGIFGSDANSTDKELETELAGDRVFVEADFVRWENWLTLINFKPVYKISRITPSYQSSNDIKTFGIYDVVDVNGGPDEFAAKLQRNPEKYDWFAQGVFISSAGINATDRDMTYFIKVTEDGLVLEPKQ